MREVFQPLGRSSSHRPAGGVALQHEHALAIILLPCQYILYIVNINQETMHKVNAKRDKFVSLATNRVNRTIKDIRLIGNLSNRSAYEFTEEDVKKIIRTLQRELELMRGRFGGP